MLLADYMRLVEETDKMPPEIEPVLFGIFGEVGSIMATAKKFHREKAAYADHKDAVVDEFGDVLWYLAALCCRLGISMDAVFSDAIKKGGYTLALAATNIPDWPVAVASRASVVQELDPVLLKLGETAATLLSITPGAPNIKDKLCSFADCYLKALQAAKITFDQVADNNISKTRGRFLEPDRAALPRFDDSFEEEEKIPKHFEIKIRQRKSGKSYMEWNGVFIGDPLTDNILDKDGYRFHDVFHFAHASILHWSPTFRALIKHKRKRDPDVDEAQDGGRAIVVEEGLTAWIFSRAKKLGFFESHTSVSFDLLKTVQHFVRGYEVQECPLKLWEHAILQGYTVFRQVKANNGGIIVCDRESRSISYEPLK